jgi:apolipoprotein N-acyltransferase
VSGLNERVIGLGGAGLSGLLLFAAGEPLGWGPLAWLALVPLLVVVLREPRWRWAWLYGFMFGVVYFGIQLSWIFLFGWMAWTALTAFLALYTSIATLVAGVVRGHVLAPVLIAGAFAGVDLARDRWPYGGYPWGSAGTTQGSVPGVRWLAGVVGVYGLTFLVVFVAALIAHRVVYRNTAAVPIAVVVVALVSFIVVDRVVYGTPPAGNELRAAVIQGGVPRPARYDQRDRILASHIGLTRRLVANEKVGVIIWPEDSIGIGVSSGAFERVRSLARELHTPMLVGHSVDEGPQARFRNLVQLIDAEGKVAGTYQKRHPVPFGEYVPVSFLRRFVGTLNDEIPYDQDPGRRADVFEMDGGRIATPICFESVFPRDFLDFARNGANLFVLSTNNASFEHSYASQQHIAHTRMRALETRQWVIQAALAGISGVMAPDGKVSHTTRLFEPVAFVADVRMRRAHSLYARTGDLFPAIWAGLTGATAIWTLVRRRRVASTS